LVLLLARDDGSRSLLACADLPVAAARALSPSSPSQPAIAKVQPMPEFQVGGLVKVWATPSGDFLLRAEVEGSPAELTRAAGGPNLIWAVNRGDCAHLRTLLFRFIPLAQTPTRQTFSLVVPRVATGLPLSLQASVNGRGPLVACADLPTQAMLAASLRDPSAALSPGPGTDAWRLHLVAIVVACGVAALATRTIRRSHWRRR